MQSPRRAAWAGNLALLAGSLAVALVGAEVLLRVLLPSHQDVHPRGLYTADAVVGYAPTPGFRGTFLQPEYEAAITIGAAGLRGADSRPRGSATYRIVCLGDSFTFGQGVGDDEAFPAQLERLLAARFPGTDVQVLNAGVPGYGTVDELRYLESRIAVLDPDLVVVQFLSVNDFHNNSAPALGRVEVRDGWLYENEAPRAQPWRTIDWLKRQSRLAHLVSERAGAFAMRLGFLGVSGAGAIDAPQAQLAVATLRRVAEVAKARGAGSLFVLATGQAPVVAPNAPEIPAKAIVERAAREAGAAFVDLTPHLRGRAADRELYYPLDGHWTVAGHAVAAAALADAIAGVWGAALRRPSQSKAN
jgi:lysophospholipase L1-like esterase